MLSEKISERIKKFNLEVIGPIPAPIEKLRSEYRYQIIIKSNNSSAITQALESIKNEPNLIIDRDPYSII